jgi:hypothetical protein
VERLFRTSNPDSRKAPNGSRFCRKLALMRSSAQARANLSRKANKPLKTEKLQ